MILSNGERYTSPQAIRQMYATAFAEAKFNNVTITNIAIREQDDIAWGDCQFTAETTLGQDRRRYKVRVRTSFVLRQIDNQWKITFEHSSPIAGVPRLTELRPRYRN